MSSSRSFRAGFIAAAVLATACSDASTAANTSTDTTRTTTVTNNAACKATLSLAVGGVSAGLTGSPLCVTGGTGAAEYALVAFNAAATTSAAFDVTATGTTSPSALPTIIAGSSASFDVLGNAVSATTPRYSQSRSFEEKLHARNRTELAPRIAGARAWANRRSTSGASFDAIPASVTVGQILRLNSNSDVSCSSPIYRGARVVAISNRAIVVADTLNPSGGYSDAEYASFGTAFDTLIDPLDRQAFGDVSDIDHNGRVVIFFTKTVNDLTPASSSSYIGGFFDARDLFPTASTPDFDGCAASNVGEMFYVMVPDPTRGGAFSKTSVANEVYGTLAHEYQHLINASRRMYVNTAASDFEETWLDEGLAHEAEELLFYRVSGLAPRQDIDASVIRRSSAIVAAFNSYQADNFGRYDEYLGSPSRYSPYADNDSLATRGAAWSLLRYAADQQATSDGDVWYRLVNSTSSGLANFQSVFGSSSGTLIRNWSASVIADDVTGVSAVYQQPSWNFRAMFAVLNASSVFPLANVALTAGAHTVSLTRGGSAYLRFDVGTGGSATIDWSAAPATVQFSLVRTK